MFNNDSRLNIIYNTLKNLGDNNLIPNLLINILFKQYSNNKILTQFESPFEILIDTSYRSLESIILDEYTGALQKIQTYEQQSDGVGYTPNTIRNKVIICFNKRNMPDYTITNRYYKPVEVHKAIKRSSDYLNFYKNEEKILIRLGKGCFFNINTQTAYLWIDGITNDTLNYVGALFDSLTKEYADFAKYKITDIEINKLTELETNLYYSNLLNKITEKLKSNIDAKISTIAIKIKETEETMQRLLDDKNNLFMKRSTIDEEKIKQIGDYFIQEVKKHNEFTSVNVEVDNTPERNSYKELSITVRTKPIIQNYIDTQNLNKCKKSLSEGNNTLYDLLQKVEDQKVDLVLSPMVIRFSLIPDLITNSSNMTHFNVLTVRFLDNSLTPKTQPFDRITINKHATYYDVPYSDSWNYGCRGGFESHFWNAADLFTTNPEKAITKLINITLAYIQTTAATGDPAGAYNFKYGAYLDKETQKFIFPKEIEGKTLEEWK